MALIRWEPIGELNTIQNEMNRLFNTFFDGSPATGATRRWIPPMDLVESSDEFVVRADLPGLSEGDINIEVEGKRPDGLGRARRRARRQRRRLPPARASLRRVLPLADPPRGRRRGAHRGGLRPRRAQHPHPQARGAQAPQDRHQRRRRAAGARGHRIRGLNEPRGLTFAGSGLSKKTSTHIQHQAPPRRVN